MRGLVSPIRVRCNGIHCSRRGNFGCRRFTPQRFASQLVVAMRRLLLAVLLAMLALPACAAKRLTVAQLEQKLTALSQSHRDDAAMVMQLAELELTERLTETTLERLQTQIPMGPKSALAIRLMADQSALLDPPAVEFPAAAYPDAVTQAHLLDAARHYVMETIPRLPNLIATRTTYSFDDSPQALKENYLPVRAGFHPIAKFSQEVAFNDSKVTDAPSPAQDEPVSKSDIAVNSRSVQPPVQLGIHPGSAYGWATALVMTDSAKGKITWSHWEKKADGLLAVFHYVVPPAASHYVVSYCCVKATSPAMLQSDRRRLGTPGTMDTIEQQPLTEKPGYHGSIMIDPATGAILRITIDADMKIGDPLARAAFVVEYGPVVLGDRASIFPVWSLTLSAESTNPAVVQKEPPARVLNETTFSHYHRLGTSMRVVALPEGKENGGAPGALGPGTGAQTTPVSADDPATN